MPFKTLSALFKNITFYDHDNYSGHFFVQKICKNVELLEKAFESITNQIGSIEDLYCFLWCTSFKKMMEDIEHYNVESSTKERLLKLSEKIVINHSSVVDYINKNYADVFDEKRHDKQGWIDFFSSFLKLCYGQYSNGIDANVFLFFEKNFPLHILASFEDCSKYYSKHRDGLERLFDGLEETKLFNDQVYLRFLLGYRNKKDSFLAEKAAFICERTIAEIKKMKINEDSQELIYLQAHLQDYGKLAILYQLKCAHEYNSLKKMIQNALDAFIEKHGVHRKFGPVNLKPAIDILKKSEEKYKFFGLTHHESQNGDVVNNLDDIFNVTNKNNPFSEVVNDISRNRSNKYPYFKQDYMKTSLWIKTRLLNLIFSDSQLIGEFANFIYSIALQVQEKYFAGLIDIEKEITGHYDCLAALIDLARHEQFETPYSKALTYSTTISICTTIEKILRNTALIEIKGDKYLDINKATLGDFFDTSFKLKDVSSGLKYYLEFYLIKEVKFKGLDIEKPGLNIRNNLMHGEDDAYSNTDYGTCLIVFYFLISLLNDLALAVSKREDENI